MVLAKFKNLIKRLIRHPRYIGKYPYAWPNLQTYIKKHAEEAGVAAMYMI